MTRLTFAFLAATLLVSAAGARSAQAQSTIVYETTYVAPPRPATQVVRVVEGRVEAAPVPSGDYYYLYDAYPQAPAYYGPPGGYRRPPRRGPISLSAPFD